MTVALKVENISVNYPLQKTLAIEDVNLQINRGQIVGIVGPNGAGKSTFLKSVLGIVQKKQGKILIFDRDLKKAKKMISYVPQRESVDWNFPINVLGVVLMGTYNQLGWLRYPGRKERQIAEESLKKVEMLDYIDTQIGELSGGQQQRVFLARALAAKAEIIFLDEPMAGVDAVTEKAIIEVIRDLKSQGKTIIMVHHDLGSVKDYFDEVVLINKTVVSYGSIKEAFTNDNLQKTYQGRLHFLVQE
jgi:manganese/zinc/iron transport system ATP- binding protein